MNDLAIFYHIKDEQAECYANKYDDTHPDILPDREYENEDRKKEYEHF